MSTINMDIPLRELKRAKTKIALYEASVDLIGDRMFHQVMVDDICRQAEISRVTFFKFFAKKEEVLIYFMRVWLTQRQIEIQESGKRGFTAIRHLMQHVADNMREKPGLMPSLISYLVQLKMHPCMPKLSLAEVKLLFPGHEKAGACSPDMFKLFRNCMIEAKQDGMLYETIDIESAVQALFSIFYGSFLTSQLYGSEDVMGFYNRHLKLLEK